MKTACMVKAMINLITKNFTTDPDLIVRGVSFQDCHIKMSDKSIIINCEFRNCDVVHEAGASASIICSKFDRDCEVDNGIGIIKGDELC